MSKKIIGFSGSPVKNSNTDKAVQAIMDASGMESEFVKLSTLNVRPCIACKKCLDSNRCIINDDFPPLLDKILAADAVVYGAYTPYMMVDAFLKAFIERLWSTRHNNSLLAGKALATVVTTCAAEYAPDIIKAINKSFQVEADGEKMNLVGQITLQGNIPCPFCGKGDVCESSNVKYMAEMLNKPDLKSADIPYNDCFANDDYLKQFEEIGKKLAAAVK